MTLTHIIINAPITLGVKGEKGDPGDSFVPDAVGTFAGRSTYNGEDAGFSYLANDTTPVPLVYWRVGVSGWSDGVPFVSSGGLTSVEGDETPQLGGDLDVNDHKIVSVSNGNIDIEPNGTGNVILGNFTFDADQSVGEGQNNYVLTYDHVTGLISLKASAGGGSGNVTKVGIPVNDQIAVWTGDGTVEGSSALTYNGSVLGVSGNITVSGTVDGRDIAADGTKLDGIEPGANNYTLSVAGTSTIGGVKRNTGTGFVSGIDAAGNLLYDTPSGGGDVVGPASATDNALALFDTGTGKLLKNSIITVVGGGIIPLEMQFPQAVTLTSFGYTGGSVVIDGVGSQLRSPNATGRVTVENGTVTITTNNVTRATITDSGLQLGGSGARVTTILDQDDMASNSSTALATQQSIKAYVDSLESKTAKRRVAVVGDIVADAPTGYDTIEVLATDDVLVIPTLAGHDGYLLLDSALWIGTRIINESANTLFLIDATPVGYISDGIPPNMSAVVTDGAFGAWKFATNHPATTPRTDGQVIVAAGTTISGATANLSAASHANKRTRCTHGSAITLTLLNQTNGAWQDGDVIIIRRANGAGAITVNAESPATIEGNAAATVPANNDFALIRTATNTWDFL